MNHVQLKLNPYTGVNTISINGRPLPAYSELNNYLREPFFTWAPRLFETIDRELNDDYTVTVLAESFETALLEALQKGHESCVAFHREAFALNDTPADRKAVIDGLVQKYLPDAGCENQKLPMMVETMSDFPLPAFGKPCEGPEAVVFLGEEHSSWEDAFDLPSVKMILLRSGEEQIQFRRGKVLWHLSEEKLTEILEAFYEHMILIPELRSGMDTLKLCHSLFSEEENRSFLLTKEVDPVVLFQTVEPMEVGAEVSLSYAVYPEGTELPKLRLETNQPQTIFVDPEHLLVKGLSVGTAEITCYRGEAVVPFQTLELRVFQNHFAQKLTLFSQTPVMEVGTKQALAFDVVPLDAEDVASFVWSVDHSDVAKVDQEGVLYAIKEGVCTVMLKGELASASIRVEIRPCMQSLTLSKKQISCYVGEEVPIRVSVFPENCFDPSYHWVTSDRSVATVERKADGTEVIRATGFGTCQISCLSKDEKIQSSCSVLSESTFKKQERNHFWLGITGVLFVISFFCFVYNYNIGLIPAMAATVVAGFLTIIKNKHDWFWAFLLMAAPFVLYFLQ